MSEDEVLAMARQMVEQDKRRTRRGKEARSNGGEEWLADCIRGKRGGDPLPVLANALIGIRAMWADMIAYDEMARLPMLMRSLTGENDFAPRALTDADVG